LNGVAQNLLHSRRILDNDRLQALEFAIHYEGQLSQRSNRQ
jgi:hypothetical protein